MLKFRTFVTVFMTALVTMTSVTHAGYVHNDPINLVDPNGEESMAAMDRRNAGARALSRATPGQAAAFLGATALTAVPFYAAAAAPAATTFALSRAPQLNSAGIFAAEVAAGDALGGASLVTAGGFAAKRGLGALENAGFSVNDIDGRAFLNKAFTVGDESFDFGGFVSTNGTNVSFTDVQVFSTNGGSAPGAAALNNIRGQLTNELGAAGFESATVSGKRLTGATAGQEKSITFSTCRASRIDTGCGG